jgi:hypothetical protein
MTGKARRAIEEDIRKEAGRLFERQASVGEFSSRFFGPDGMLRKLWKTDDDRRLLISSPIYRELRTMLSALGKREVAAFESDAERLSGRLTVVVPKSLHAALREEAVREGISLSELIRLKLGVPYRLTAEWIARGRSESEAA